MDIIDIVNYMYLPDILNLQTVSVLVYSTDTQQATVKLKVNKSYFVFCYMSIK